MRGHNPLSKYKNPSQFNRCFNEIVKPVSRGHIWNKEKQAL